MSARYALFAPAKINLDLHITGKRDDGYHTLRSHVVFADYGDELDMTIAEADCFACDLVLDGPYAFQLAHEAPESNLVVRAARLFCDHHNLRLAIGIKLTKNLPSRSGLGGGSSDAAAILRGLAHHTGLDVPLPLLLSLGADVPVCYVAEPVLMEGIGDRLTPTPDAAMQNAVIIWDAPGPTTASLYAAYDDRLQHEPHENDFQPIATTLTPGIRDALQALEAVPGCHTARLTGSGSAVFGLFNEIPNPLPDLDFHFVQPCQIGPVTKPLVRAL